MRLGIDPPDFIFLDIEMPEKDGFDIIKDVKNRNFDVIFVTAYSQYAIQAIKHSAFDYLLKPIEIDQLQQTVERLSKRMEDEQKIRQKLTERVLKENYPSKIAVATNDGYIYLKPSEIVMIEGEGSYSKIFCFDGKHYTVTRSLGDLEKSLDPTMFFRTHKSQIVSLDHVRAYSRETNVIFLKNDIKATLSRRKKKEFLLLMNGGSLKDIDE